MTSVDAIELQARYALVADLATERRVLDIGCGDGSGLALLAQSGATTLTGLTNNAMRAQQICDRIGLKPGSIAAEPGLPLPYPDDAFDLVICNDLGERMANTPLWSEEIRRILAPEGYLLLAVANPGGKTLSQLAAQNPSSALGYDEIFERLAEHYDSATLYGQSPVVASLFFDFESEEEDPDPSLDRSLLTEDSEEAGWLVLLMGPEPQHRDDLTLVQHPYETVCASLKKGSEKHDQPQPATPSQRAQPAVSQAAKPDSQALERIHHLEEELRRRERVVSTLEHKLEQQEEKFRQQERALEAQRKAVQHQSDQDATRQAQLSQGESALAAAQKTLEHTRSELSQSKQEQRSLEEKLQTEQGRATEAHLRVLAMTKELDALREQSFSDSQRLQDALGGLAQQESTLRSLEIRAQRAELSNLDLNGQLSNLNRERATLKQNLRVRTHHLEHQLTQSQNQLQLSQAHTAELQAQMLRLTDQAQALRLERTQRNLVIEQARRVQEEEAGRTQTVVKELVELRQRFEDEQRARQNLNTQADQLTQALKKSEAQLHQEQEKHQEGLQQLQNTLEERIRGVEERERTEAEKRIEVLRAELAEETQQLRKEAEQRVKEVESQAAEQMQQKQIDLERQIAKANQEYESRLENMIKQTGQEAREREAELKQRNTEQISQIRAEAERLLNDARAGYDAHLQALERDSQEKLEQARRSAEEIVLEAQQGAEQQLQKLKSDQEEAFNLLSEAENARAAAQQETQTVQERVLALESQLEETQQALARAESEHTETQQALARAESEHTETQQALARAESDREESARTMEAQAAQVSDQLELEVARLRTDQKSFEQQIKDLLDEGAKLWATNESLTAAKETAERELEETRNELQRNLSKHEDAERALQNERGRADQLMEELSTLRDRIEEIDRERQKLQDQARTTEQAEPVDATTSVPQLSAQTLSTANTQRGHSEPRSPDAAGDEIQTTLEELEDLITTAIPSTPPRR